jgi:hypothetical protein
MIAPELFLWSERSEIEWLQAKMSKCEVFHIVENGEWDPCWKQTLPEPECRRDSAEDENEKSFNVSVLGYSCMIMMRSDATEFGFTSPHYVPTRCPPIPYMPTRHCLLVSRTTHVHSLNHQPRCYSFERLPTSPTSNIPEQRTMPKPALYSDPQKSSGATIRNGCRIAASTY